MENHYATQPAMPVSFDPARYLRQPGRTQVATLVAASFFGCLLALLLVYGLIILATKMIATRLLKQAQAQAEAMPDEFSDQAIKNAPRPAPRPQPKQAILTPTTPAEARLLTDVLSSDDEEEETDTEPIDEEPAQTPADVPEPGPVSILPKQVPTPTAAKRTRR